MDRIRAYFDYNVFNGLTRCDNYKEYLADIDVFYSVAHVEEFYKAYMNLPKEDLENNSNKNFVSLMNFRDTMISVSKSGVILNPTYKKIRAVYQKFDDCLKIVSTYDTRLYVEKNGANLNSINKNNVKDIQNENQNAKNYSNKSQIEIWDVQEVIKFLDSFNLYYEEYKSISKSKLVNIYGYKALKIRNNLPESFELKKFCFKSGYDSFQLLELVIEFLNNVLCTCGYNKDSDEKKTQSGIHDVSHMIYGTYCDYFVSNDKRMLNRAKAIYYYLGINTKAVNYDEFKNIVNY